MCAYYDPTLCLDTYARQIDQTINSWKRMGGMLNTVATDALITHFAKKIVV